MHLLTAGKNLEPELVDLLSRYSPAEVIFNPEFLSLKTVLDFIKEKLGCSVTLRESECFDPDLKKETVYKQFSVSSMDMLGLAESGADVCAVCGLFEYIGDTQKTLTGRFTSIERQDASSIMALDLTARRNLELTETLREKNKYGSLLWAIDKTSTNMGARLLKSWICQPLKDLKRIIKRQEVVKSIVDNSTERYDLQRQLKNIYDIQRLSTKLSNSTGLPRDF